jgi:O-antigen/teichoic acid export membrane protein
MKVDQIMIGKMLGSSELGVYSVAVTIAEIIYFIPMSISGAAYPKIAKAKKEGKDYESLIVKIGSFNVIICLLFAIACTLLAPILIQAIYGAAYRRAGEIIQIYSWSGIFVSVGVSHSCYIIFNNLQKYALFCTVGSAIINVILNIILIPVLGIKGAVIATIVAYIHTTYIFPLFMKDKKVFLLRVKSLFFYEIVFSSEKRVRR